MTFNPTRRVETNHGYSESECGYSESESGYSESESGYSESESGYSESESGYSESESGYSESESGYSLIELLVAISIFGVIALAGLPHVDTRREDINTSVQRIVADMRYARSRSITSGEHYAIEWTSSNSYELQRLALDGATGDWEVDSVQRTVELPDHIVFTIGESTMDRFEFNTRGMMVSSSEPVWPVIFDVLHSADHTFSVWPSGQIYVEE